jgi:hypothetical protein
MKPTEQYLRSATRGLWGRAKRELRQELQGHLQVRIQEWRLGGLTEAEAERQTLRELGAPEEVRTGMLGVYTLPALGKGGLASLLTASLLISILPQGQAQSAASSLGRPSKGPPVIWISPSCKVSFRSPERLWRGHRRRRP